MHTDRSRKVLEIATKAHKGQFRQDGTEYIMHPMTVANNMYELLFNSNKLTGAHAEVLFCACLLHDVIEDCMTETELVYKMAEAGLDIEFVKEVVDIVKMVTHDDDGAYRSYIMNMSDERALAVKYCDIKHNLKSSMYDLLQDFTNKKALKRVEKYTYVLPIVISRLSNFGYAV